MSRSGKRRATPEVQPSPETVHSRPGLRTVRGGGRGAGAPSPVQAAGRELWLAVHLPNYVLESLRGSGVIPEAAGRVDAPTAVVDLEEGGGRVVCACDGRATAAGITRGMALNSALALQPALRVRAREIRRERALLKSVAARAFDFTPRVALEPPDGVLLEVRGSLRLFGGARRLIDLVREQLQSMGVEPWLALAPTPLASLWFARAGEEVVLSKREGLASRLGSLPLSCTRWPVKPRQLLATVGVRSLGDCLRLPRDGFARRFEPALLRELDRAVGRQPDPRATFVRRERFTARRDLEPEVADTERLGRTIEPLLTELCTFLRLRGRGIEALELKLVHRDAPATRVWLRLMRPTAQAVWMAGLLHERLACTSLPEPVRAVRLRSGVLVDVQEEVADLFARDTCRSAQVPQLIERLQARLGADAVQGIRLVPEHRPEFAWENRGHSLFSPVTPVFHRVNGNGEKKENVPGFLQTPRPLWLLAEPQRLEGRQQPRYEGTLELEEGPERIESGWWDGRDVQRDYYVARSPAGVRLWVFRERRAGGRWFLHGVFG